MEYNVELTDEFLECSEEIFDYITNTLKNKEASDRLRDKIIDNVLLLENLKNKKRVEFRNKFNAFFERLHLLRYGVVLKVKI